MLNSKAISSWSASISWTGSLVQAVLVLVIINAVLTYKIISKQETVIVVPPTFSEEITFVGNQASEAYKTGWGLFAANLTGNISERNQSFVVDTVRRMLPLNKVESFAKQLSAQVEALKIRNVRESFTPLDLIYNSEVDTVWVYGDKKTVSLRSGAATTQKWTFEYRIAASNGMPKIIHANQYQGAPNTRKRAVELKRQQITEKQKQAEANKTLKEGV